MRQPQPLPTEPPFLTIYTPTFMRPTGLARLMKSIACQTAAGDVEHLVLPDYVGYGIVAGLFQRIAWYAPACRGRYVTVIGDDDVLPDEKAVATLRAFAERKKAPEVLVVRVVKNGLEYPTRPGAEPQPGEVDLCNYVLRRDVWLRHAGDYGSRYEGDYDHAAVLHAAGYRHEFCPEVLWVEGEASHGRQEVCWP